jgi:hypothetical protein
VSHPHLQEPPVIVPTPIPVYTFSPDLEDVDPRTVAAVERCVASLAGHVRSVLVTAISVTERHLVVEMETSLGPVLILELLEDGAEA